MVGRGWGLGYTWVMIDTFVDHNTVDWGRRGRGASYTSHSPLPPLLFDLTTVT